MRAASILLFSGAFFFSAASQAGATTVCPPNQRCTMVVVRVHTAPSTPSALTLRFPASQAEYELSPAGDSKYRTVVTWPVGDRNERDDWQLQASFGPAGTPGWRLAFGRPNPTVQLDLFYETASECEQLPPAPLNSSRTAAARIARAEAMLRPTDGGMCSRISLLKLLEDWVEAAHYLHQNNPYVRFDRRTVNFFANAIRKRQGKIPEELQRRIRGLPLVGTG